ncbi:MAG: hypothetical protein IKJ43_01485 [Bacilli bacterium]|nr:hypothetical protein [Bacilli bacterium]
MENKILIDVIVPILEENYNVFIPVGKTVKSIEEQLKKCIADLSLGAINEKQIMRLYDSDGKIIDSNCYIKDSGIKNGSKVILV